MSATKENILNDLLKEASELEYNDGKLDGVKKRAIMITKKVFGDSSDYVKNISAIRFSPSVIYNGMEPSRYTTTFNSGKKQLINTLKVMIEDIQLSIDIIEAPIAHENNSEIKISNKIFIVHGHNEVMKQSVARFVEKISHEAIILHEQANTGKTIIEKFTNNSDVSFAIVLLSADDLGIAKEDHWNNAKLRARQNVIFELGFFLGKLGRERVVVLHELADNFEFPSDYQGVLYIPFDLHGNWKFSILREMKASGHAVDANVLL